METINPHACREGFEQQREAGINVDWFTWQIAWHDAMFTQVDCAPLPASANRLTDEQILAIAWKYHYDEPDASGYDFGTPSLLEFARAIIAATEAK